MRNTARRDGQTDELMNRMMSAEQAAVAAYELVLSRCTSPGLVEALQACLRSHRSRVATLLEAGAHTTQPLPWKKMSGSVLRLASSVHPWAAVSLLLEGERNGLREYQAAASHTALWRSLVAAQRATVRTLETVSQRFLQTSAPAAAA